LQPERDKLSQRISDCQSRRGELTTELQELKAQIRAELSDALERDMEKEATRGLA
jgi:chaperonin cofactor prefoldin